MNTLITSDKTSTIEAKSSLSRRGYSAKSDEIDNQHLDVILDNNKKWVDKTVQEDPEYFKRLAKGQKPKYLYFGCSDSRVPANHILGLEAGEVFVQRNIGNLIPGNDLNALSVLEYAVEHLGVSDIIVCGHYDCGAIRAATAKQDLGMLENWLRLIRDVYRLHKDHLDHIDDYEERHHRLVELNVVEQCLNLYKTGVVQRKRIKTSKASNGLEVFPRIYGLVYNPAHGFLKRLHVDFDRRIGNLEHIYSLY
jgi:carbonic anhydrase